MLLERGCVLIHGAALIELLGKFCPTYITWTLHMQEQICHLDVDTVETQIESVSITHFHIFYILNNKQHV